MTLFRFGRTQDAFHKLDTAADMVKQIVDARVSTEQRTRAIAEIHTLRTCLLKTKAPALATIIVRPFFPTDEEGRKTDHRPVAEAFVRVEDLAVGEISKNGMLRVQVPSGPITVRVLIPPDTIGEREVTLAPGTTTTVRVGLDNDKESLVGEPSVLMLPEAVDGVVPAGTRSLTLRFETDDGAVRIVSLDRIDIEDDDDREDDLNAAFEFDGVGFTARDATPVLKALARDGKSVTIRVVAGDADGFTHDGRITIRVR